VSETIEPTEQSCLRLGQDVTFQSLGQGQDTVLLSLKTGYLYTCNETTTAMLELMDGRRSLGQIIDELEGQFDVSRQKLSADLLGIAGKLLKEGLVVFSQS